MRRLASSILAASDVLAGGWLYRRFRHFTMLPLCAYVANIELVRRFARRVPGAIVECGTWRGGMAVGMVAATRNHRTYHFFDSFAGLPAAMPIDGDAALRWQANTQAPEYYDNCYANYAEFVQLLTTNVKTLDRITVHAGLFDETTAHYASSGEVIAVLRLDGDWYESTLSCLQALYDHVAIGGVIILDDYHTWDGCARAVHDFLSSRSAASRVHQSVLGRVAYIVKRA